VEVQELFAFLDGDEDGIISLTDFTRATVAQLQRQQLQQALKTEELGVLLADMMPTTPGWDNNGKLRNALAKVVELKVEDLKKIVEQGAHQVLFHCLCCADVSVC
jgi:hypothetical protein